jgi:3-hydroxybutyryl-CoA dehydrogenase
MKVPLARVKVGVLGAGLMGHGIAQVFMSAGFKVTIWDPVEEARDSVIERIKGHLRLMDSSAPVELQVCDTLEACVRDCDFVVEATPESLVIKRDLIGQLDHINPHCVIGTNTSVLRITEIAEGSLDPTRVVGTHWWNPPYLIPIVEVVRGECTSEVAAERAKTWLLAAGKLAVDVFKDVPGFVGNRMQFALLREAMHIVEEGICSAETLDLVASQTFGRRLAAVGPLRGADFIGLDLVGAIMNYLSPSLASDEQAPALVRRAIATGRLGAKTGSGIFEWGRSDRAATERRLTEHLLKFQQA